MNFKELIQKTDTILYNYLKAQALRVHLSKQKELLQLEQRNNLILQSLQNI